EIVALEHEVAADRLLDGDERSVGGHRLAILQAYCRRRHCRLEQAGGDSGLSASALNSAAIAPRSSSEKRSHESGSKCWIRTRYFILTPLVESVARKDERATTKCQ